MGCPQFSQLRWMWLAAAISMGLGQACAAADAAPESTPSRLHIRAGNAEAFSQAVLGPSADSGVTPENTAPPSPSANHETPSKTAGPDAAIDPEKEPLKPTPDPQPGTHVDVRTAGFNGVSPGESTLADVQKAWGAPAEVSQQKDVLFHLYHVAPFDRVEVAFREDKVASIIVRLDQAFPADKIAPQLQLGAIQPVLISNELGEILGEAFPERGVLFAFQESDKPGKATMMVTQIILEPVGAEPFILRAETRLDTQPELSLHDLNEALRLAPQNARAHWLRCRVLAGVGDLVEALAAGNEAVRLEPDNPRYLITQGQVLGSMQRFDEAIDVVTKAVQHGESRPHLKARALCMLGDLYGSGVKPDYQKALRSHTEAIQIADPLAKDQYPAIRLAAKEVLIDAHLGAAHDIAWGNWNQKEVSLPRWLSRAESFAEDLIEHEGGSPEYRLRVATRALAAVVGVQGRVDPTPWVEKTTRIGQELMAASNEAQKAQYEWNIGMALYDAVQSYQLRNANDLALKYGEQASDYLEKALLARPDSPESRYMLGRLYFRLGAIRAMTHDHAAAIAWFEKALPAFDKLAGQVNSAEAGRLGETYVSMGVSYWENGQKDRAVTLTQRGVKLMEKAVGEGVLEKASLEIPYGNLASMNRRMGRDGEDGKHLEKASRDTGTLQR